MKTTLLLLGALWVGSSHAQYFTHTYGLLNDDVTTKGIASTTSPNYIAVGVGGIAPNQETRLVLASPTGASIFAKSYVLLNSSGVACNTTPDDVEEHNGSIYSTGVINNTLTNNAFLLKTDFAGNILSAVEYTCGFAGSSFENVNICKSINNSDLFITGTIQTNIFASTRIIFAMRVDANGSLAGGWSFFYYPVTSLGAVYEVESKDAVNTNYYSQGPNGELVLAGRSIQPLAPYYNSSMLFIDPTTGLPYPISFVENDFGANVTIKAINTSAANGGSYVLAGGYTDPVTGLDALAFNTNQLGVVNWNTHFDQSYSPSEPNEATSIVERLNTLGNYEYYAAGYAQQGPALVPRRGQVLKIDNVGGLTPLGEFTKIANPGVIDNSLISVDNDFIPNTGFVAFGQELLSGGTYEMEIMNAYYNGVIDPAAPPVGCGFTATNIPFLSSTPTLNSPLYGFGSSFSSTSISAKSINIKDNPGCFTNYDPSGNNNFTSGKKKESFTTNYDASSNALLLALDTELTTDQIVTTANINIIDITGRVITKRIQNVLQNGLNQSLLIQDLNLSTGIYVSVLTVNGRSYAQKFIVK